MKRRAWFFALLLVPLLLAIPLWPAASWKPHRFGVQPIRGQALLPFIAGTRAIPPQYDVRISPDGTHLLSVSTDSKPAGVAIWNLKSGSVAWKKQQTGDREWKPLCFSRDGKTLVMAGNPGERGASGAKINSVLGLFDVASGRQNSLLPIRNVDSEFGFSGAVFSPDGKELKVISPRGITIWNLAAPQMQSGVPLPNVATPTVIVHPSVQFSPNGREFLADWSTPSVTSSQFRTEIRDENNRVLWQMPSGVAPRFDFSPDGKKILSSDQSSLFEMRDARNGRLIWKKTLANTGFNARDWLADSSAVVIDINDKFEFWDVKTGAVKRAVAHTQLQNFCVAPDESQIYFVDFDGQIWSQRLR